MKKVSVIVPVRNGVKTLRNALGSVLVSPIISEVVVVDDGSTDGSAESALALDDPRIRIIPGPCIGISGAINAGFQAAQFDYVLRCDADDQILASSLEHKVSILEADSSCVAVSGGFASMTSRGAYIAALASDGDLRDVTELLRTGHTITHFGTWLTRRTALMAIGGARDWFVSAEGP